MENAPMGVSQWKNHGIKFGYDKYFNINWDMPQEIKPPLFESIHLKDLVPEVTYYGLAETTKDFSNINRVNNIKAEVKWHLSLISFGFILGLAIGFYLGYTIKFL